MRAGVQVPGRAGRASGALDAPGSAARADAREWLLEAVLRVVDGAAARWLHGALERADDARAVDIAFGSAPRRTGRAPLASGAAGTVPAAVRELGALPRADGAARALIALAHAEHEPDAPDRLLRHADVDESVAVYRVLALFPDGTRLDEAVGRGLRTHAQPVFEAIAHDNPWPTARLDEHRWNHMILKALFVESALHPIRGLDARANPTLARMLLDFADERRAAGRPVPDELWRCALPFASADRLAGHVLPRPIPGTDPDPDRPSHRTLRRCSSTRTRT